MEGQCGSSVHWPRRTRESIVLSASASPVFQVSIPYNKRQLLCSCMTQLQTTCAQQPTHCLLRASHLHHDMVAHLLHAPALPRTAKTAPEHIWRDRV